MRLIWLTGRAGGASRSVRRGRFRSPAGLRGRAVHPLLAARIAEAGESRSASWPRLGPGEASVRCAKNASGGAGTIRRRRCSSCSARVFCPPAPARCRPAQVRPARGFSVSRPGAPDRTRRLNSDDPAEIAVARQALYCHKPKFVVFLRNGRSIIAVSSGRRRTGEPDPVSATLRARCATRTGGAGILDLNRL